jgi:hypothetical protein
MEHAIMIGSRPVGSDILERPVQGDWDLIVNNEALAKINSDPSLTILRDPNTAEDSLSYLYKHTSTGECLEVFLAKPGSSNEMLLEMGDGHIETPFFSTAVAVPSLMTLSVIKKAHLTRPLKWFKHQHDYKGMKKALGIQSLRVPSPLKPLFKARRKETESLRHHRGFSLNIKKEEFFTTNVEYFFDHDQIHHLMALGDAPAYTLMQGEEDEVMCRHDLWSEMSHEQKLACVIEESCVIAVERYILPHLLESKKYLTEEASYAWAVKRVSTTLCKGFFREFALEYFDEAMKARPDYLPKFMVAWEAGQIQMTEPAPWER